MFTQNPVTLLINLLIAGLIVWGVYWFVGMLALPDPIRKIVMVTVAVVALLWLMRTLGFPI